MLTRFDHIIAQEEELLRQYNELWEEGCISSDELDMQVEKVRLLKEAAVSPI